VTDEKETPKAESADDESRRRFEEALERKRHRAGHGEGPHGGGKSVTQHADMKRQRTFRRKSGG
jgi:Family of unknown function (DUF5302)